jgi:hypothetical protein
MNIPMPSEVDTYLTLWENIYSPYYDPDCLDEYLDLWNENIKDLSKSNVVPYRASLLNEGEELKKLIDDFLLHGKLASKEHWNEILKPLLRAHCFLSNRDFVEDYAITDISKLDKTIRIALGQWDSLTFTDDIYTFNNISQYAQMYITNLVEYSLILGKYWYTFELQKDELYPDFIKNEGKDTINQVLKITAIAAM